MQREAQSPKIGLNDKKGSPCWSTTAWRSGRGSPATAIGVSVEDDVADYVRLEASVPTWIRRRFVGRQLLGAHAVRSADTRGRRLASSGLFVLCYPGRRAVAHEWDGKSPGGQQDEAKLNPPSGGQLQPDPGLDYYRHLKLCAIVRTGR